MMSSIVTTVLKATIGFLVNKGRDTAAEKLKDSDVTDEKIRGVIVRDLENIKEKLDALSRKDLLASISFFKEGIEYLREVLNKQNKASSRSEYGAVTTQAACAEAYSLALAQGMKILKLTDLDESASRALFKAKKKFEDSGRKATEAFHNEALETSDRILAMQYRVMAAILETIDNPADAVASCRVCIEELNSLSAVQNSFNVQLKKGLGVVRGLFGKDERREIIANVCHVNRVIYDVTLTIGKETHWPAIDIGEDKIDLLRDERVAQVLRKQGMEHCCVTPWSLGQKGEEEHKLKNPWGIATYSSGQFIVGDEGDKNVKVFDSKGTFVKHFSLPDSVAGLDVTTDMNDNIYVLVALKGFLYHTADVYEVLYNTADLQRKFRLRRRFSQNMNSKRLIATDSGKFLVLTCYNGYIKVEVDVYESDGRYLWSFGKDILDFNVEVSVTNDGRVVAVDRGKTCFHIFSEQGDHLNRCKLQRSYDTVTTAFYRESEHIVVAGSHAWEDIMDVNIYTKDGKFVRSIQIRDKRIGFLRLKRITINTEGRIAVICRKEVLVI